MRAKVARFFGEVINLNIFQSRWGIILFFIFWLTYASLCSLRIQQ